MSRSIDFHINSPSSVEQILLAFSDEDYWLARVSTFGGPGRLDTFTVGPDGSVAAVIVTDVRHSGQASPIARFLPREWRVVQTEAWHRLDECRARGRVSIVGHGTPGSATGTALLAPAPPGSHLECTADVGFKVPLIGGQIENIMSRVLVQNISALQSFTTEWIREHA